jgi:tetratricopeptide (TPR) repeat protein
MVACRQAAKDTHSYGGSSLMADSLQIKTLIEKGKKFQNGNADSLPGIAWELESVSNLRDDKTGMIYASMFKAYYYWFTTDYATAMKVTLQALTNAEKWKIRQPIPEIYSIMANMHKENGNYTAAFQDCIKGLNEAKQNRDTASIISLLGLRAMFTHGYYRKNGHPQDDHTSLQLQFEALKIAESSPKYERMRIRFYNNIAQAYKENKAYDKTLMYANKAVVLANKYNQPRSLTYSYNWLGEAYYYMGQRQKGIAYLDSAIAISRRSALPYRQMEIYESMHWCYMSAKDYEPAIASLNRFNKMRDSLQIAKNEKQISELQLKYETGKKDKQIAVLDDLNSGKNRKIVWVSIGMFFFLALLIIILYQNVLIHRNSKLMKASNEQLNDALLKIAHIQSHHIRQPLASILGLMNIIKAHNYEVDKEVLQKMDTAAHDLDQRIRDVIKETEVGDGD